MKLTKPIMTVFFILEMLYAWDAYGKMEIQGDRIQVGKLALQLDKQIIKIPDEGSKTNMGVLFKDLALYEKATDHYKKSLQTKKKLGDEAGEAIDLDNMGRLCEAIGDYPDALKHYEQALAIFRKLGKADDEARILNDMGELHRELGDYAMALDCYQMALARFKTSSLIKDEATVQNNVSLIYEKLGLYERALESHRLALAMFRKLGDPRDESAALLEIAATLFQIGKYDQGIKSALDALQLMKKAGISTDESTAVVAGYYMDLGKTQEAEALLNSTGNLAGLARLALIKGDYEMASSVYSRELTRLSDDGNPNDKFSAYTGLGKTYLAMKNFLKAQDAFHSAVNVSETIRSTLAPSDRKQFFNNKINGFLPSEAYKGLAHAKFRLDNPEGGLEVGELLRSRRFSAYMADGAPSKTYGVPRDLVSEETTLVNRIAALKKELNSTDKQKHKTKYDNISILVNQSEKELTGVSEELWRKRPAYASIKYPRPFRLTEIPMTPGDYVIVLDVFDQGVAVQLIHDNKIIKSDFISQSLKDVEADVAAFGKTLDDKNPKNFDHDQASSLFNRLFQGVVQHVPEGVSLKIIPDGILNLLPFDALVIPIKTNSSQPETTGKNDPSQSSRLPGNFLGDRYFLSLHESISSMSMDKTISSKIKPPKNALIIADPIFSWNDDIFGSKVPTVTLNTINKSNLVTRVSQNSDGFGYVIFATPIVTTNSCPVVDEPFIALSTTAPGTDGYLRLSDILSLRLPSDVVALLGSPPDSGRSGNSGQGVADMARAFQYAGAKSVLMSLWDVDEKSATMFMEKFFTRLKNGESKKESLKKAKVEMRREGYEHPHYWSGYILFGDL